MIFFIFGRCPKNCSTARKKIILPDSGGGCSPSSPPPSSYAYANVNACEPLTFRLRL